MAITQPTIPQALSVTGRRYGAPPPCAACQHPIDTADEYWALLDGPPDRRPALIAAAHRVRWDDRLDDYDDRCAQALRQQWRQTITTPATLLWLGADGGGPRFYAGPEALHAGTPLDVLTADGTWLDGRFEYHTQLPQPPLYLPLGGWDLPTVALQLLEGAVVRIPD